jgi:hypothetical protein
MTHHAAHAWSRCNENRGLLPAKATANFFSRKGKRMKTGSIDTPAFLLAGQKTRSTFASDVPSLPHLFATLQPRCAP